MEINVVLKASAAMLFSALLFASFSTNANEPTIIHYDISGKSARILRAQMDVLRPIDASGERFDAKTRNTISYTYRYSPTKNGCKFTEFAPTLETVITMPRWIDFDPTSNLGEKWQSYYQALYQHELGHRDIGLSFLKELEEVGEHFETAGKCDAIADEFKIVYASIIDKAKLKDRAYDLETNHGKKLGSTFP